MHKCSMYSIPTVDSGSFARPNSLSRGAQHSSTVEIMDDSAEEGRAQLLTLADLPNSQAAARRQ